MAVNGHDHLGVVHTHRMHVRALPYDVERAKGRTRRRVAAIALVGVVLGVLWLALAAIL